MCTPAQAGHAGATCEFKPDGVIHKQTSVPEQRLVGHRVHAGHFADAKQGSGIQQMPPPAQAQAQDLESQVRHLNSVWWATVCTPATSRMPTSGIQQMPPPAQAQAQDLESQVRHLNSVWWATVCMPATSRMPASRSVSRGSPWARAKDSACARQRTYLTNSTDLANAVVLARRLGPHQHQHLRVAGR